MNDNQQNRGKRIEVKLRGYSGIYKVRLWDVERGRYIDARSKPSANQKAYRAKKRVRRMGQWVQSSCYFDSLAEAHAWRISGTTEIPEAKVAPYTLGELAKDWRRWMKPPRIKESTFEMYGKDLQHMRMLFEIPVGKLSAPDIDQWIAHLVGPGYSKKSSRYSFSREVETLGAILRWYREYKNSTFQSPMLRRHRKDAVFREKAPKLEKAMSAEQLEMFLDRLKAKHTAPYYYLAAFQAFTGVRIGEACGLRWECVDLEAQWATIERIVWWRHTSREPVLREGTKTGASRRVFLCGRLVEILREWKVLGTDSPMVFHRNGAFLHYPAIQNAYNKAFRALKMPFRSTHILRHSFATLFANQTGDREALRSMLGHQTFAMTEKYAHAVEQSQVDAMKQFRIGKVQQAATNAVGTPTVN